MQSGLSRSQKAVIVAIGVMGALLAIGGAAAAFVAARQWEARMEAKGAKSAGAVVKSEELGVVTTVYANTSGVSVEDVRPPRPEMERKYRSTLTANGHRFDVSWYAKWAYSGSLRNQRYHGYAELTQADGRYILFDIENPADKIIDQNILKELLPITKWMLRLDEEFARSDVKSFTDETGATWVKQH